MKLERDIYVDDDQNIVRVTKEIMSPQEFLSENWQVYKYAESMGAKPRTDAHMQFSKPDIKKLPNAEDLEK